MKIVKKILGFTLALVLVFSLISCSSSVQNNDSATTETAEIGSRAAVENFPAQTTNNPLAKNMDDVPNEYLTTAKKSGEIVSFIYDSIDRAGNGEKLQKEAKVYLPYGYDENDNQKKYDIIYLMHGWTGNNDIFFNYDDSNTLQNVLDHMIENEDIDPAIVVAPTFDRNNKSTTLEDSVQEIKVFHEELRNELMPSLEGKYHTYAYDTSIEGLKSSRDHRAFVGFSLGATIAWNVFLNDLDYFRYILPISGSCWVVEDFAMTEEATLKTAEYLADYVRKSDYGKNDFYIYTAVGSNDEAFDMANGMANGLIKQIDIFDETNLYYGFNQGAVHWWDAMPKNLYNAIPYIFENKSKHASYFSKKSNVESVNGVNLVALNNGVKVPSLGLGTQDHKLEQDESIDGRIYYNDNVEKVVAFAIQNGYRHIDTAHGYNNEDGVGRGIKKSGVPREKIWITSKLWPNEYGEGITYEAINKMLDRLDLTYLDCIYLHHPVGDMVGAWKDLIKAYKEGKVRALGISNFDNWPEAWDSIVNGDFEIKPQITQIECNPFAQRKETRELAAKYNIQVECWYPLGNANDELFNNETLVKIANAHGKTVPQIILRFETQDGLIVVPGSTNESHIVENINIFDFELSEDEMNEIRALDKGEEGRQFNLSYSDPSLQEMFLNMSFYEPQEDNNIFQNNVSQNNNVSTIDNSNASNTLVLYFDYSENMGDTTGMSIDAITGASLVNEKHAGVVRNNILVMVDEIKEKTGAEVFGVKTNEPYAKNYMDMVDIAREDINNNKNFTFKEDIDLSKYDTIYIGMPVWWSRLPQPLKIFVENHDFSGKEVIPFGIHRGSRFGSMVNQLKELCKGANVSDDGLTVSATQSNDKTISDVDSWLENN